MSTPRDPAPNRAVFVRRRLIIGAVVLAVVAVVVLLIVRPGSNSGPTGGSNVEIPKDLAGADTPEESEGGEGDVPACAAGQVEVTPLADRGDYAAGEDPELSFEVENTGEEPCWADLGTATQEFVVASGADEVWRSTDCQQNAEHLAVTVDPGKPIESEGVVWDRTRSSADTCDISRDTVSGDGASYHFRVSVAGVQSTGTAQFLLY
ncbi:hypothetical protein [Leucobacter sp. USHLN153]|uniref:hypothetical protein n=1 Tax=Leucobacter sp. USHLN153 TaxID=3081268 RepID=UPI003018AF86